ncbi:glycoside hydrolase family 97 protein [Sinomicrobium kalidii]|uniref:glycoside hydrolase family 97 protein n=1 Tax=Sinomicrobium kalidii TaxID=2900738 RepID=UPI001E58E594|nr:glycoside hydrolase family 97 protein [Sinomicrobium kalidii]UGU16835.1 glycoside hydrolase family 97 protein [Sinomicrobium kalidii]
MYNRIIVCLALSGYIFFSCNSDKKNIVLVSPDMEVRVNIRKDSTGYNIKAAKQDFVFMEKGFLGLNIREKENLFSSLTSLQGPFPKQEVVSVMGITDTAIIKWNEYLLEFSKGEQLEFRVFDQGTAYRYKAGGGKEIYRVTGEESSWTIPADTKVWYFERNNNWKLKSYAGEWMSTTIEQLPVVSETGPVQGKPLIFGYSNGGYGILAEAGLFNYSGLRYEALPENTLKADFFEGKSGFEVRGNVISPWRIALVAEDLNQLVHQQNVITSLNPEADPALFADRSWIRPGRSVWRWWSNLTGTPEEEKKMIDAAEALDFEYNLIDAGWEKWPGKWQALKAICDYGKEKDVGIWVWKHSKELNFPEGDYQQMQSFMDSLHNAGVSGIKVDFMDGERKTLIDFDEAVLRHAAARKLMVNFHGCQAATGEIRSYPNELTREGIRGLELNTHPEGPITASHNAALPFTRFVSGHGDYTPLAFTATGETTWAHQLATLVLFTSPLQVIAENPEILLHHPSVAGALPLIKEMPTVWDETLVLPGSRIGELAIMARRKGDDWYIGIINGGERKTCEIDLAVLNSAAKEAILYHDASESIPNPIAKGTNARSRYYSEIITPFVTDTVQLPDDVLSVELEKNGGAVLCLGKRVK